MLFPLPMLVFAYTDRRISRDDLEQCLSRLQPADNLTCYLCGPQPMVDAITTTLEQLGVENNQIYNEKWW